MRKTATVLIALLLALSGCAGNQIKGPLSGDTLSEKTVLAMDTMMSLKAAGPQGEGALEMAAREIENLDSLLSVTDQGSEIYALNHAGGLPVTVSGETLDVIRTGLELGADTKGALDITIYPLVRAWGFTTGDYRVPGGEELASLLPKVDYSAVETDPSASRVRLPEGAQIDLGSVAKGYAGDRVIDILRDQGVKSAIVSLGGSVHTLGNRPDGSRWRVAVKDPKSSREGLAGIVTLSNQAAVTSGGYERYFQRGDKIYWHILDPKTGQPAESGLLSVTVIGDQGAVCDGLSTALFILGKEGAMEYWRQNEGFELILITDQGELILTSGLEDNFSILSKDYTLTVADREMVS